MPKIEKMRKSGARFVVLAANDIGDGKFEVIYLFHHMGELLEVRLCVGIDEVVPTITDLFPAADFLEREMVDLFGVNVEGAAPNLLLEPGSGISAPLRKRREGAAPGSDGPAEQAAEPPSKGVGA
jgi:NADH:ubiquinone oxidoreductase subunit C